MDIRLTTLGGLRVVCDDRELDWLSAQRARAALFVYLAVERSVSRAAVATVFWPDSDEERARQSLRQGLYHLRKVFGSQWVQARAHELRTSASVHVDAVAFSTAVERGDAEAAARLYGGPFLDGINLLDVKPWENWVDGRRALHAREFRKVCREWVDSCRAAGDAARAVEAARHWVAPDPFDDEAQHRLIQALADAGERAEAIRQYESYIRLLEADGLRPLGETIQLIELVRSTAMPWPEAAVVAHPARGADASSLGPGRAPSTGLESHGPAETGPPPPAGDVRHGRRAARRAARRTVPRSATRALVLAGLVVVLLGAAWLAEPHLFPAARASLGNDDPAGGNDSIVLADFDGPPADPALGAIVTDALRIDLQGTGVVRVVDSGDVSEVLRRMHVADDIALTPDVAREVALRHGAKAVLEGQVARVGSGWVLTASLRSAESGRTLASFRETALQPEALIPAIDRLSRALRRGAGESLRAIDAAPGLAEVTTSSLDALRLYGEADRAFQRREYHRAALRLEDAVALDPDFAMAWRLLAAALHNAQADRARQHEAATRAWALRERLPPRERHLTAAAYHHNVTRDWRAAMEHYRRVLEVQPRDEAALNNLALLLRRAGDFDAAAQLLERSTRSRPLAAQYLNLVGTRLAQGRVADAASVADALSAHHHDALAAAEAQFAVHIRRGDDVGARAYVEPLLAADRPARERAWAHDRLARLALWRGRIDEARRHLEAAEHIVVDAGPPHNPVAWRVSRAYAEVALGDPGQAVALLMRAGADGLLADVAPAERHHLYQGLVFAMADDAVQAGAALSRFEAEVPAALRPDMRARSEAARALIELHGGAQAEAVRRLEAVRVTEGCGYCNAALMGWALRDAGRMHEAAAEWEDAIAGRDSFEDMGFAMVLHLWILQRLPAVYEAIGDTTAALRHHRRLVELWEHADPELQPVVRRARERIRALQVRAEPIRPRASVF